MISGTRVDWVLFAGTQKPVPLINLTNAEFQAAFDDFMGFDLNNAREIAGAAIAFDDDAPFGSTNKPGILRPEIPEQVVRPSPGLWADPAHPGAGVAINRVDNRHYLIWYTYDEAGLPIWYFSDTVALERDGWRAQLFEFTRNAQGLFSRRPVGQVIHLNRSRTTLQFSWRLGARSGTESFRYLPGRCTDGVFSTTGTWYDPAQPGYGMSVQEHAEGTVAIFYFYGERGLPRWAYLDFPGDTTRTDAWVFTGGACPTCEARTPVRQDGGSALLRRVQSDLEVELTVNGVPGLNWQSVNRMIRLSSPATCS